jgi:hypothetical protein
MVEPQEVVATCHFVGFCALKTADQAAWAGAVGSFFAAFVALGIAVSGSIGKAIQRRKDGRALAAYIHADLFTAYHSIGKAIANISEFRKHPDTVSILSNDLIAFTADVLAGMMIPILQSKVDQFGKLPSDIGEELAGAVGSMGMSRAAVERFAARVRQTQPAQWDGFCQDILDQLHQTRGNMKRAVAYCRKVGGDL